MLSGGRLTEKRSLCIILHLLTVLANQYLLLFTATSDWFKCCQEFLNPIFHIEDYKNSGTANAGDGSGDFVGGLLLIS